jgi:hypothetical protein
MEQSHETHQFQRREIMCETVKWMMRYAIVCGSASLCIGGQAVAQVPEGINIKVRPSIPFPVIRP